MNYNTSEVKENNILGTSGHQSFVVPTVDDWFRLGREYRRYLNVDSRTLLKDYGSMQCMVFMDQHFSDRGKDINILEIGHGFSPEVMMHLQKKYEVWGVDENQGLHYFDADKWEENYRTIVVDNCPEVRLVRGLIGSDEYPVDLPSGYFDVIYSISVLEEVSLPVLHQTISGASQLLRPGGWLIGTHDLNSFMLPDRLREYFDIHRECGLILDDIPNPEELTINWEYALIESPAMVMLAYQAQDPEETRRYKGHWTTMFTAAQKR